MIWSALVLVFLPTAVVAVRVTVYLPALAYAWTGSRSVLVAPSPKFHSYLTAVSDPTLVMSMKSTGVLTLAVAGLSKFAGIHHSPGAMPWLGST